MRSDRSALLVWAVGVAIFATGCAGARTDIVADGSRYPLSLSRAVRDADGRVLSDDQLEHAAKFHAEGTAWGILYSAVRLTPQSDLSSAVNEEVQRAGGDAIVDLKLTSAHCAMDFVPILNLLPVGPGCAKLVAEGDIVRVRRGPVASDLPPLAVAAKTDGRP